MSERAPKQIGYLRLMPKLEPVARPRGVRRLITALVKTLSGKG